MRYLFAHAHPDDETLASGALIAELVDQGHEVYVLTATRGEMGDVVEGPLSHLHGTPELLVTRERELAGALAELGVTGAAYLGAPERTYRDSGMVWVRPGLAGPADSSDERSFTAASMDDAVSHFVAYARSIEPDVIVSYDADGGYGHPDHVRMHEVATAGAAALGVPFRALVYERIDGVEWFEVPHQLGRVQAALNHHRTQLTVHGDNVVHSGGQREPIVVRTGLR